jgi:hypothetical protein
VPVQLVHTKWVSGNLVFYDDSMNIIATWDGTNRQILVPSGSTISLASGATLSLGGTTLVATGSELNASVSASGLASDGLTRQGIARFTFDATGVVGNRTIAAHGTGVTLPANALVIGGFYEVNTAFTSTNSTSTIAISVEGANDIVTATAVSNAIYGTIGRKAIIPKSNTPESTSVKATVAREITCTVGVEALLGGKLIGFLKYVVSAVSA